MNSYRKTGGLNRNKLDKMDKLATDYKELCDEALHQTLDYQRKILEKMVLKEVEEHNRYTSQDILDQSEIVDNLVTEIQLREND
ncbi:MAG: hypothetical protein ACOYI4_00835 [Christensenellales bacterium]